MGESRGGFGVGPDFRFEACGGYPRAGGQEL